MVRESNKKMEIKKKHDEDSEEVQQIIDNHEYDFAERTGKQLKQSANLLNNDPDGDFSKANIEFLQAYMKNVMPNIRPMLENELERTQKTAEEMVAQIDQAFKKSSLFEELRKFTEAAEKLEKYNKLPEKVEKSDSGEDDIYELEISSDSWEEFFDAIYEDDEKK